MIQFYLKHILTMGIISVTDMKNTDTKSPIQALDSSSLQSVVDLLGVDP